jgi:hypothetical protein
MGSGAHLMVKADGSVTYSPDKFVGTDSFVVTATYGSDTKVIPVQMLVGGDKSFEAYNIYSFTNKGSVTYIESGDGYTDTLTDNNVPFFTCFPCRRVTICACDVRIDRQDSATTLGYSNNTTSQLRSTLYNFTRNGARELVNQVIHVRFDLKAALDQLNTDVTNFNANQNYQMPTRLSRWFGGADYVANRAFQTQIFDSVPYWFDKIRANLDDETVTYYDDPSQANATYYGYSPGPVVAGVETDVAVARMFWTGKPNTRIDVDRYGTAIHELAHALSYIDDVMCITDANGNGGYFNNPVALQNETQRVQWYADGQLTTLMDPQPDTATLLLDADAYAGYLTQYYYRWGPLS